MSLNKIVPSMGAIVLVLSSNRDVKMVTAEEKIQLFDHQNVGLATKIMFLS